MELDQSTTPIDVGTEIGTLRIFWRYHFKTRFLVVQDSIGIEQEIRECDLYDLDTENPNFNERFIAELCLMLEGKSKKEQMELKRAVCNSLNLKLYALKHAIWRFKRKQSSNDNFNDSIKKINTPDCDIEMESIDRLDEDSDYAFVKRLVSNFKTVPVQHHLHKLKRAYYTLGTRFGTGNAEKWIDMFDAEYARLWKNKI